MESLYFIKRPRFNLKLICSIFIFLIFSLLSSSLSFAKPVGVRQAEKTVKGWLKRNPKPLDTQLGKRIKRSEIFSDDDGLPLYYVIYLRPEGFIIVPADDEVEPIIAIVAKGTYDPSPSNPLGALISTDIPSRIAAVRQLTHKADKQKSQRNLLKAAAKAQKKWSALQGYNDIIINEDLGIETISDVRVAPLVQTRWGQIGIYDYGEGVYYPIYDYYTPGPHYYSGCVATAMAQLMKYHEHPTTGVGTPSFTIYVSGVPQTASLRGGDGLGGPYDWANMVNEPDEDTPELQRQAIGAICYDAGVSVNMNYTPTGSSANLSTVADQFVDNFDYNNAVYSSTTDGYTENGLFQILNPNLDANLPVILSVDSSTTSGRHALICDGYGFDSETIYHHLNFGWTSHSDAWYDLPDIGTSYEYDIVDGCIYNVFIEGSGEAISGRITDTGNNPIEDVTVFAHILEGDTYLASTNAQGIYAFPGVPPNTTYYLTACKLGWKFDPRRTATQISEKWSPITGNIWGIDLTGTASEGSIQFERDAYMLPEIVTVRLIDEDLLGNDTHTISLRTCSGDVENLTLTEYPDNSGMFTSDINTIQDGIEVDDGNIQVLGEEILFAFYEDSNDGTGTPVRRYDKTTITNEETIIYETDFEGGLPEGWTVIDGNSDGVTWTTSNPGGRTSPQWSGQFAIIDAEFPPTDVLEEELITHALDFSMYERVKLCFKHDFRKGLGFEGGRVAVRVDGGDWRPLVYYASDDFMGQEEVDITPWAAGEPNVQIQWYFVSTMASLYWGIDDVNFIGIKPMEVLEGDFEPDCDVDSNDLFVLAGEWLKIELTADFSPDDGDDLVNFKDWAVFAKAWQSIADPPSPNWDAECDISPEGGDGIVDANDADVFINQWLRSPPVFADIAPPPDGDGIVNMLDFALFAQNWMLGK